MSTTTRETSSENLVEQTTSELADAATTVQDKAVELKDQGRGKLAETLDRRTTEAGGQVRHVARVLRQGSGEMRTQGDRAEEQVGLAAEWAADRVERLGGYLEQTNGDHLLRDAEEFARRRPWLVAGMGLVAGLAASRFLKASSERRYRPTGSNSDPGRPSVTIQPGASAYERSVRSGATRG